MLENLCSLPLSDDVFALAVHPRRPLISVGLASGSVRCFRLPASASAGEGSGTVDTAWKTRRHKGSVRALEYSYDGEYAFSAGTDGLLKHFSAETGRVLTKILVPRRRRPAGDQDDDPATLLHALAPQTLLLACDSGALHVLDLRTPSGAPAQRPAQTHVPHDDYVSGLAPLAPTEASTTNLPRQWATTGGTTLAVTDLRRGVITRSEGQEDELLCVRFVAGSGRRPDRRKWRHRRQGGGASDGGAVVVGTAGSVVSIWDRGAWDERPVRVAVDAAAGECVDALAVVPEHAGWERGGGADGAEETLVVAGMGDGSVRVVDVGRREADRETRLRHDEGEGVIGLGFDALGRLITAGGRTVKVWEPSVGEERGAGKSDEDTRGGGDEDQRGDRDGDETEESGDDGEDERKRMGAGKKMNGDKKRPPPDTPDSSSSDSDSDSGSGSESSEDEAAQRRKRAALQKQAAKRARLGPMGAHGVLAFDGID